MPSADSHDYQLNDWRKKGEDKTVSTKTRYEAQKKWLEDQLSTQKLVVTLWQDDRDKWAGVYTAFLKKGNLPSKTADYVSTSTTSGGTTTWTDSAAHDAFFTGNNPINGDIGAGGFDDFATWITKLNTYLKPIKTSIRNAQAKMSAAQALVDVYSKALEQLQYTGDPLKIAVFKEVVAGKSQGLITTIENANQEFVYNASGVVDSYFKSDETFAFELNNKKYQVMGSNTPRIVKSARELWQNSSNHKGMISSIDYTKIFRGMDSNGNFTSTNPIVPQSSKTDPKTGKTTYTPYTGLDLQFDLKNRKQYAFQFLYNPGSVDMTFMGTPDVDVGYEISGSDQFSLIGGLGITQSTITFDLVINRMFDMKYYDAATQHLKEPFKTNPTLVYKGKTPTTTEQQLIYRRGTMYDVDYLLRTLLGYAGPTTLRFDADGAGTADIGYLGAMPVELHLGQNLRYLGIVNGLSVRHVIFNERMVPLFSTLHVQFNRIPDFPATSG